MVEPGRRLSVHSVAAALASACILLGCTSGSDTAADETTPRSMPVGEERIMPDGDDPEVFGPLGETDAEFETDDGVVQIGSADVPDVVPETFPIPADLEVQLASQAGEQAGFSGVSDLEFDALVAFYESQLPEAGFGVERSRFVDGVVAVFDFDGSDGSGQVVISSAPGGGHSVLVTFES